jgi:hypothetical protein
MDALVNLIEHIPDWIKRLDDLNGQIEQRQQELAALGRKSAEANGGSNGAARSLKNKGSTESLRPRDEPEAHPAEPAEDPAPLTKTPRQSQDNADQPTPSSPADSKTPSAMARHVAAHKAAGQAGKTRARAVIRKRQRTESMMSGGEDVPKYRTRSMIIVYYDSYVQTFFEDLVKFVSASRNMMRKAKMAAKVAQIRRLAELEMPDDDDDEEGDEKNTNGTAGGIAALTAAQLNGTSGSKAILPAALAPDNAPIEAAANDTEEDLPPMRYISSRHMQAVTRSPNMLMMSSGRPMFSSRTAFGRNPNQPPDVYDQLDKGLEYVQGMCEHAAHQFLRDGDCAEEVGNIERRLGETKELADKEMERVRREEPEALKAHEEELKGRVHRPLKMAKDMKSPKMSVTVEAEKPSVMERLDADTKLEVDEGFEEMEEEITPPKLMPRRF